MKIKRLLPLVLLAAGALFALSGCDALLDAIYAHNSITVTVAVTDALYTGGTSLNSFVQVSLGGASGGTATAYYSGYSYGGFDYYYVPKIADLPSGNYTITTYYNNYSTGFYTQYVTTYFNDPGSHYVTSMSLPYGSTKDASVTVVF